MLKIAFYDVDKELLKGFKQGYESVRFVFQSDNFGSCGWMDQKRYIFNLEV